MVKSCDSTWPRPRRKAISSQLASYYRVQRCAGLIMDMKVQGSRSGKALGIGELLANACSASAPLDRS